MRVEECKKLLEKLENKFFYFIWQQRETGNDIIAKWQDLINDCI